MPARDIFRIAMKERTRRVQLRVGLQKGSPGEFTCTQSLPLGALMDGPNGDAMRFLDPLFQTTPIVVRAIFRLAVKE